MKPEKIMVLADRSRRKKRPLKGKNAEIFVRTVMSYIRHLRQDRSGDEVYLECILEIMRGHEGIRGMKHLVGVHGRCLDSIVRTIEFFHAVSSLGLKPSRSLSWAGEALWFFYEDEDECGFPASGNVFPSIVMRNWAMTAFTPEELKAVMKATAPEDLENG